VLSGLDFLVFVPASMMDRAGGIVGSAGLLACWLAGSLAGWTDGCSLSQKRCFSPLFLILLSPFDQLGTASIN